MTEKKLMDLFNVHTGEGKMVVLLIGLALLESLANAIARTTTYALFLAEFDAGTLPYTYIGIAIFATLVSYIYLKFTERFSLGKVLLSNSAFITVLLLGLWFGVTVVEGKWVAFSMPVVFGILNTLMITAYWGLIGRVLNIQQSKRLTGLLATGETIAFMVGGFLMPLLVLWVGAINVLLVAAIIMIVAWGVLFYVTRFFANQLNIPPGATADTPDDEKPADSVLKSGYIRLIFALFTLFIVGVYFVDNIFYDLAEIRFPDADELASFIGLFWGVSSTIILLMQAFVSGRIMVRYGVGVVMMLTPIVLAIESGTMAVIGTIFGVTAILFWLAVIANISRVVLDATDQAAVNVLYQPLPSDLRTRAQTMVNGIFYPISIGLAGVLLLLFRNVLSFDVVQLTYVVFVITFLWITVAVLLRRAYPQALIRALTRRDFGDPDYLVADPSSLTVLGQGLESPNVGLVLYSLDLLETVDPDALPAYLPNLLEHHTSEVRLDVLRRIEHLELSSALPVIKDRFKYEGSAEVRGASLRTMAVLGGSDIFDEIYDYLDNPDPRLRQGVMVGMLRSGEFEGIVAAAARLTSDANSANPAERIFAAQILGESGMPGFYRPLLKLLHDEDRHVQQAALVAASKVQQPKLWPAVVDTLASKSLRAMAVSTLAAADKTALPYLEATVTTEQDHEILIRVAQILGRMGGTQAIAILQKQLDYPDELVRTHILLALNKCGYQSKPEAVTDIEDKIKAELAQATWVAATLGDLDETDTTLLLRSSLTQQLNRHRLRVVLLLSFIYNPQAVRRVQETLGIGMSPNGAGSSTSTEAGQQKSYALETIDVLLPSNQKAMVLPLMEGVPADELLQRLNSHFPQESKSCEARLLEIITEQNTWLTAWTKAAALYTVARLPAPDLSDRLVPNLNSKEPIIRETSIWTLFQLKPTQYSLQLEKAADDSHPQVSDLAKSLINTKEGEKLMLSTVEKVMALKSLSFFTDTPNEVLVDVAAVLKEETIEAGEVIFEKGESGSSVYIIAEGEIRIHDGERTIAQLSENDAFGEMSILDPDPRSATATAVKDSHLLRLDQEPFRELITDHSDIAWRVMQILTQRLRQAQSQTRGRRDTDDLLGSLKKKLAEN